MSVNVAGGDLQWDASIDLSGFRSQLAEIRNGLNSLADEQKKNSNDIAEFAKKAAQAAAGYFSIQAASDFVQSMVQVRGEFQQIEVAYRTMLGSKEKADQLMAESVKLAAVTPFGLQDVASGSKQLLAYGFAAKEITGNLEMLGNVASGVGSQLNDVVYLYGTLKASGRVTQMDINQFAGRGIPIYQALADTMKITTAQVREYVSAGKVGFPDVEKAFKSLTGAGGQFFNLMQEQSKTLTGQLSNLSDAWDVMLNELGRQNEGVFATAIGSAITLVENYEKVIDILGALVAGYGAYRAALLLTAATTSVLTYATAGFTAAEILHYYWTTTLTKAQKLLNITMLANPYVAVATALATLGTYLYLASENTIKLKTASELNSEAVQKQGNAVETAEAKLKVYVEMLKNTNLSEVERLNIYNKIKSIDPSIVKGIDAKTISYKKLKTSVDAYIVSLRQKFAAEANEGAIKGGIENENSIRSELNKTTEILDKYLNEYGKKRSDAINDGTIKTLLTVENNIKDRLLKQQIETNKLIGNSIQTGSKDQIKAAENDLKIIEDQKKRYKKGSIELATLQKQAIEKQDELNALRRLKQKDDGKPEDIVVIRNVTVIDKEIEALKEDQKTVSTRKEHAAIQVQINKLEKEKIAITGESAKVLSKYAKDEQEWQQKRLDFQNKINDAYSNFNIGQLNQNAQEIAQNKAKYDALRKDFKDYNDEAKKEGKSLLGASELSQINNLEDKELYSIKYNQQTRLQAEAFEKQKKLYEDYEDYKTKFGQQEADKRFGNELKSNKQLLSEQSKIVASLSVKSALGGGLNAGETARFEQAKKYVADLKDIDEKRYSDAYEMAITHSQNIERINEQYRQAAISLGKNITDEQKSELLKQRDAAIEVATDEAVKKTEIYRTQSAQVLELSKKQIKDQISVLKTLLDDKNIPKEIRDKIEKEVAGLELSLKIGINQNNINAISSQIDLIQKKLLSKDANGKTLITKEEFERLKKELQDLIAKKKEFEGGKNTSDFLNNLSGQLGQISGAFGDLSNALGGVDTEAGYTLDTISQLVGVASDAAGAAASFASGDIIGGVTKTIKAVAGIFSIGKKVKEMNKAAREEVEAFYANAIAGERAYIDLLRERELQTVRQNKLVLQGIRDELALRKEQSSAYKNEANEIMSKLQSQNYVSSQSYTHGTWFRKASTNKTYSSLNGKTFAELSQLLAQGKLEEGAKALVERLVELEKKGYDAEQAMADLARETNAFFTGTTADAMLDGFADAVLKAKGDTTDFTEFFEKSMEDASMSIFKNNILSKMINQFYDDFAKSSSSGDILDKSEIEELRVKFLSMSAEAQQEFEKLKEVTGLGFKVDITVDSDISAFGDKLFSLLTTAADKTGAAVEQILSDYILQALKTEVITNALKPLADKVKDLYKDGKIPTKNEIAEATAEMNLFIENARAQLKTIEEATGLTFAENLKEDLTDAAKAIDNELQSISNSIKDVFANTDGAYENFLVKFDDMVKNKILTDLQTNTLQSKLTDFMTQFNALDKVEDSKKQEQLALLKAEYAKIIREGKEEYDRLQEVFGVDYKPVNTQNQGSISSGIQRITEETANVMVGPILGTYEETKKLASWVAKQYAISTQALEVAIKTEQNTRRGADNTEGIGSKLDEIVRNTRPKATGQSTGGIYVKPLT